ncbi:hypothetical protein HY793_02805 [Candidatus Desantisbacteria bacterium]|nr:hypothetical protein [Candidatus Desantisbacteria bacterium]
MNIALSQATIYYLTIFEVKNQVFFLKYFCNYLDTKALKVNILPLLMGEGRGEGISQKNVAFLKKLVYT